MSEGAPRTERVRLVRPDGVTFVESLESSVAAAPPGFVDEFGVLIAGMRTVAVTLDASETPNSRLLDEWRRWCQQWDRALGRYPFRGAGDAATEVGDLIAASVTPLRAVGPEG